jgi:hypothetical protein
MPQQLDLAVPQITTRANVMIQFLHLDLRLGGMIVVGLLGSDGVAFAVTYSGATALTLMTALNVANLSVKSLHQRVLEKLALDGFLPAGTVSGVPS